MDLKKKFMFVVNWAMYGNIDQKEYRKISKNLYLSNMKHLNFFSFVALLIFFTVYILSLSIKSISNMSPCYLIAFLSYSTIYVINKFFSTDFEPLVVILEYLFDIVTLGIALCNTLIFNAEGTTTMLLVFFILVPVIFTDYPYRYNIIAVSVMIIYYGIAAHVKPESLLSLDIVNVSIYGTLGMVICVYLNKMKMERFVFENGAIELAELRYEYSYLDSLTGLLNRRAYSDKINALSSITPKHINIIEVDINGLKYANDTHGHDIGDEMIVSTAKCIEKVFGAYGGCYRTGGDEFVIITEHELEDPAKTSKLFLDTVSQHICSNGLPLSVSFGMVTVGDDNKKSIQELFRMADKLMYKSKADYYNNNSAVERRQR